MTGVDVTELHTQDGYDWPNGVGDERWPKAAHQPAAPYFRAQWRCFTCADTGVLWAKRLQLTSPVACPDCRTAAARAQVTHHPV